MLYKIEFTETAFGLLSSFHPKIRKLLKAALKDLKKNPSLGKNLVEELTGYQSYPVKRYRIIYKTIEKNKTVQVHYMGHRRSVYELFPELVKKDLQ